MAGAEVTGYVRLMPPSGPVRPGSYDFSFESYFDGIGASGFFMKGPEFAATTQPLSASDRAFASIENVRQKIAQRIRDRIGGPEGEIAAALVVGVSGGIPEDVNEALRRTGLYHIISISGLHMAMVAGTVMLLMRLGFAAFPGFTSHRPVKKYAAGAALLATGGYLFISGAEGRGATQLHHAGGDADGRAVRPRSTHHAQPGDLGRRRDHDLAPRSRRAELPDVVRRNGSPRWRICLVVGPAGGAGAAGRSEIAAVQNLALACDSCDRSRRDVGDCRARDQRFWRMAFPTCLAPQPVRQSGSQPVCVCPGHALCRHGWHLHAAWTRRPFPRHDGLRPEGNDWHRHLVLRALAGRCGRPCLVTCGIVAHCSTRHRVDGNDLAARRRTAIRGPWAADGRGKRKRPTFSFRKMAASSASRSTMASWPSIASGRTSSPSTTGCARWRRKLSSPRPVRPRMQRTGLSVCPARPAHSQQPRQMSPVRYPANQYLES
jgi:hypothetical protein